MFHDINPTGRMRSSIKSHGLSNGTMWRLFACIEQIVAKGEWRDWGCSFFWNTGVLGMQGMVINLDS